MVTVGLRIEALLTISGVEAGEEFIQLYKGCDFPIVFSVMGHGTASQKLLDAIGLEDEEKSIVFALADKDKIKNTMKAIKKWGLHRPGTGIVMTVPLSSMAGLRMVKYVTNKQPIELNSVERSEPYMNGEEPFSLIFVIAQEGYSELVVREAQEKGGATGATIIRAKGVGMEAAKQFFGVSIADEKEIVLIVCRNKCKNRIMEAIMDGAGMHTKAKSIVFSVPVSAADGLWILNEEED
jgi:nitrogen regulatory protein PII